MLANALRYYLFIIDRKTRNSTTILTLMCLWFLERVHDTKTSEIRIDKFSFWRNTEFLRN